jgi:hypothetical protein
MPSIARLTAVLALACGVVACLMARLDVKILPIELPHNDQEIREQLEKNSDRIVQSLGLDRFFIAAYASMFLGYALLHWLRGARGLAGITAILAIAAAVLDVAENRAVLAVMRDITTSRTLYAASSMKWLMFFLVITACAPLFLNTPHRWMALIAAAFAVVGIAGVAASVSLAYTTEYRDLAGLLLLVAFLPIVAATVVFLWKPQLLVPGS